MALQRQITLRNVKGTALTYAEMDQNLSSFFYSASLSGPDLLLHYTGSATLNAPYTPTSITVPLTPVLSTISQLSVAGQNVGDVQYRIDNSTLGATTSFKWDTATNMLGVGTPSPAATLHVTQLNSTEPTRLRVSTEDSTTSNKTTALDFYLGNTLVGSFGKTNASTSDIYTVVGDPNRNAFTTIGSTNVIQTNSTGVGIFSGPNSALTVKGVIGVGSDTTANQGLIGSIDGKVTPGSLPAGSSTTGLLIESPKTSGVSGTTAAGGHVVIGINTVLTNTKTAFSVIAGAGGAYTTSILTATAEGKVGINKATPQQALDIVGNAAMTGNINVGGEVTIGNVQPDNGVNTQVLTRNSTTGLVQYAGNLMPKGGIIMWGGTIPNIPTGWKLCDGNSGAPVNGVTIPDLRERFIVGAGGQAGTPGVITYNFNKFSVRATFTFTTGASFITGDFIKVNESSEVRIDIFRTNFSIITPGQNPLKTKTYALYSLDTGTPTTSYFIVHRTPASGGEGNYRLYRGRVPADGTSIATYPYYDFPPGSKAELRCIADPGVSNTDIVVHRPNAVEFQWQRSTSGYAVGDTGGFTNVKTHISEMPLHSHDFMIRADGTGGNVSHLTLANTDYSDEGGFDTYPGGDTTTSNLTIKNRGGDFPHENRPPYYALAFIIYTGS